MVFNFTTKLLGLEIQETRLYLNKHVSFNFMNIVIAKLVVIGFCTILGDVDLYYNSKHSLCMYYIRPPTSELKKKDFNIFINSMSPWDS